jgi:hypothetical protein
MGKYGRENCPYNSNLHVCIKFNIFSQSQGHMALGFFLLIIPVYKELLCSRYSSENLIQVTRCLLESALSRSLFIRKYLIT